VSDVMKKRGEQHRWASALSFPPKKTLPSMHKLRNGFPGVLQQASALIEGY
jgi:hypothetical protein